MAIAICASTILIIRSDLVLWIICGIITFGWILKHVSVSGSLDLGRWVVQIFTVLILLVGLEFLVAFDFIFEICLPQRLVFFGDDNVTNLDVGGVFRLKVGGNDRVFCANVCIVDIIIVIAHHVNIFFCLVGVLGLGSKLLRVTFAISLNRLLGNRGDLWLYAGLFPSLLLESETVESIGQTVRGRVCGALEESFGSGLL
jgi:hypothetical protein